jgi:hypothetical protein
MGVPVLVQLSDDVRRELEAQALSQGVGLETLLSDLAAQAARAASDAREAQVEREALRKRIREESARVAAYVATSPEAQSFYNDWGTPTAAVE